MDEQSPVATTKTNDDEEDAERNHALVFAWDDLGAISCCRQQTSKASTRDGYRQKYIDTDSNKINEKYRIVRNIERERNNDVCEIYRLVYHIVEDTHP